MEHVCLTSAFSIATNIPVLINRTGRRVMGTLTIRVYGPITCTDAGGAPLLSTLDLRGVAAITSANFVKVGNVAQVGYRAILQAANPLWDEYVFPYVANSGDVISVDFPATNGANTQIGFMEIESDAEFDVELDDRRFYDLVGEGTFESLALLRTVFVPIRTSILQEYDSYLVDAYGTSKLALLATSLGVTNWRILFRAQFWASLGGLSSQQKKRNARVFSRNVATMIRMLLSDCQFLEWYSS